MGRVTGVGPHAAPGMFNANGGGVGSWAHCSSVLLGPKVCRIPGPTLDLLYQDLQKLRPVTCFYKASLGVFFVHTNKLKTRWSGWSSLSELGLSHVCLKTSVLLFSSCC